MIPTVGRIVLYTLSAHDADQINRRRTTGVHIAERIATREWPLGAQAHIGNPAQEGQEFPMMVVRLWGSAMVNGQVFLDGNDVFWASSREIGAGPGTWRWPPKV